MSADTVKTDEEEEMGDARSTGNATECLDEAEEQPNLSNILSTTRSGRQPKVKTSYTIEIPPKRTRKRTRVSPTQKPSEVKVFKSYAEQRLQRLQQEHENALARKKLQKMQQSGEVEEGDQDDGRSDSTSEMMSEVESELGNGEMDEAPGDAGLTNNLQSMIVLNRNSSATSCTMQPAFGNVTSPVPSLSDPSVKKVVLLITTPNGKQTALQVNLTSAEDSSNVAPGPSGIDPGDASDFQSNLTPVGMDAQTPQKILNLEHVKTPAGEGGGGGIGGVNIRARPPAQTLSPVSNLTTLANVSSPYKRVSHQQVIRTVYGSTNKQLSQPSRNVFTGKIMDGKIVSCPPLEPVTTSLLGVPHTSLRQPSTSNVIPMLPAGQTTPNSLFSQNASMQDPGSLPNPTIKISDNSLVNSTPLVPSISLSSGLEEQGSGAGSIATEPDSSDHLLTLPGTLPDLDMSLSLSGNLDVVAYEESIVTMSDPIIAQQVDVASSNPDGSTSRQSKRRHASHEPFIPPIK